MEHARQIRINDVLPLLQEVLFGTEAHDAGIGDHDVEATELRNSRLGRGVDGAVVAHVGLAGHDATVQRLHHRNGFGEVIGRSVRIVHRRDVFADVDPHDVGAVLG